MAVKVSGTIVVDDSRNIANVTRANINSINTSSSFAFNVGGVEDLRIDSSGNVAVGKTSTTYKLEVAGSFAAQTKSFVVDHQSKSGQKLVHGSLEGPENGVYTRGESLSEVIELPDYWAWLINEKSITISLTPIGKYQKLYVEKIKDNKIYIKNADKRSKSLHYFYTINAERKDVPKLIVEL